MLTEDMIFDEENARPLTKAEIAERVAAIKEITASIRKAAKESPLPEDFIDYCKGRKFMAPVDRASAIKNPRRRAAGY
jgi:hypothetical protein